MYAVVDIETTGLSPHWERITEIAVIVHDGNQVVEEFSTLINPERLIPSYITKLTGISNSMVEDAPRFCEIARKIVEMTEGKIFVAHNASFDYNFIRAEFSQLGYEFSRKTLCTVKLSRKLIPGKRSYSLGNICAEMGIRNNESHRASGDAKATVKLLEHLLRIEGQEGISFGDISALPFKDLNPLLKKECIENLPEKAGVYYFYNENKDLIYIGKSNNIYKRVITHLRKACGKKLDQMRQQICDIDYELTGSDLVALLRESALIKEHQPLFNRRQRHSLYPAGIYFNFNKWGYIEFTIDSSKKKDTPLSLFSSRQSARDFMSRLQEEYELCQKLCDLYENTGACFHYTIGKCKGACLNMEPADSYNERASQAIASFEGDQSSFLILDDGRNTNEKAVVLVEQGQYKGYGYMDMDSFNGDIQLLTDCIKAQSHNKDVQQIIRNYISKNSKVTVIGL
jgi:DNA polymerase III subunit epsilon